MAKTIMLTGATDGIGLALAKKLAADDHVLLLHGRNTAKLGVVTQELSHLSASGRLQSFVTDLSDLAAVAELANKIAASNPKIDVLINNAGVFKTEKTRTSTGLDVRFAVNTLAPYLLTQRLLPLMVEGSRVVNLSSAAQAPVNLAALAGQVHLKDDFAAYAQSKLALTMWSRILGDRWRVGGPTVIAVNPGSLLATKMVTQGFGVSGSDIGTGAEILFRAAFSSEFSAASGQYYDNDSKQFADPHPDALDNAKSNAVTQLIEKMIGAIPTSPD